MLTTEDKRRIEEENKYNFQRAVGHGTEEYTYIKETCEKRWNNMAQPCKGCKFRYPKELNNPRRCCIFPNVPRDWD